MAKAINKLSEAELVVALGASNDELERLRVLLQPLQAAFSAEAARRSKLKEELAERRKDDISYIIKDSSAWKQWEKMMPPQAYNDGVWSDTNEQAFKLMFQRNAEPCDELIAFIHKYQSAARIMRMGVFRHDLSRFGMWFVELQGDTWVIYDVTNWDYKRSKMVEFSTKDLKEMLRYVSTNHYYEDPNATDSDEEDDDF